MTDLQKPGPNLNLSQKSLNSSVEQLEVALSILNQAEGRGWCRGEPITDAGKKRQLLKMLTLVLVPILILLGVSFFFLYENVTDKMESDQLRDELEFGIQLGQFIHVLERERDMSAFYLSRIGPDTKTFLLSRYPDTDDKLMQLTEWPVSLDRQRRQHFHSPTAFQRYLNNHRNRLDLLNATVFDEIQFYSDMINVLTMWLYDSMAKSKFGYLWTTLVAYQKIVSGKQALGVERALGTTYFAIGGFPSQDHYESYNRYFHQFQGTFRSAAAYSTLVKPIAEFEATLDRDTVTQVVKKYRSILRFRSIKTPSQSDASTWFDAMTLYIDSVLVIQQELMQSVLSKLKERSDQIAGDVATSSVTLAVVIMLCPIVLRAVYKLTKDIQACALSLADMTKKLNREKRRTESLLYQMLPKPVAEQLKAKKDVNAEYYKEVSIFFSDVVGFSRICEECKPMQIVSILNTIYTLFDERISHYDVYKVETIGDSYMVASGVPNRVGHRHVAAVADMALDLLSSCSDIEIEAPTPSRIRLRMGIHSGPCVAGIVGSQLPRYCLFGDTVNTASRMENNGLPNRIHVSNQSQRLLNKIGGYVLQLRGPVEIKGKGKMVTFWLIGKDEKATSVITMGSDEEPPPYEPGPSTSGKSSHTVEKTAVMTFGDEDRTNSYGGGYAEVRALMSSPLDSVPHTDEGDGDGIKKTNRKDTIKKGSSKIGELAAYVHKDVDNLPKPKPVPQNPPTLEDLEKLYKESGGSPPILQLIEGVHF